MRGIVISGFGRTCLVRGDDDQVLECMVRGRQLKPVTGDRVRYEMQKSGAPVVEALEPRSSTFLRADRKGRPQIIAANLDRIVVVLSPEPEPTRDLLSNYLVAARALDLEVLVVFNKCDMAEFEGNERLGLAISVCQEFDIPRMKVSAKDGTGIAELVAKLAAVTTTIVGQSGAGKSSIINAILPDLDLRVSEISSLTGKGKHTTTTANLYAIPGGGYLVDSPGVWEYGLWKMDLLQMGPGFPEFRPYLGSCKFRDCLHLKEPKCAVLEALEAGDIPAYRWESYERLVRGQDRY